MKTKNNAKELVNDNVTRRGVTRHCEEGKLSAARRGNLLSGLLRHFVPRNDECYNTKPNVGKWLATPLLAERARERVCYENSATPQSLLKVKHSFTYSLIHLFTSRKRFAFTLAEILVTLAVIGIVAAMTIPTLINNYQEKVTVTKVKKMYSTLNQAVKLAEVDNGPVSTWDLPQTNTGGSQKLYSYLKPYLKVAKECVEDNSGNCLDTNSNYYFLNETEWADPTSNSSGYGDKNYVRIILNDGSLLWFRSNSRNNGPCGDVDGGFQDVCGVFWYDVNGSAAPNTMAKDIFSYFLRPSGVYPHIAKDCYLDKTGWGCSKWILENDNMDYPATKSTDD